MIDDAILAIPVACIFGIIGILLLNIVGVVLGVADGNFESPNCHNPMRRIEIIFPGHQLGCWLAQPLRKEAP